MIRIFLIVLALLSSINAMDYPEHRRSAEEYRQALEWYQEQIMPAAEKTAEQLLAESRDKPEFMSWATWIEKERPDFSEAALSSHPLFPALQEVMQLVDFEVDAMENFIHKFMETDMLKEQGITLLTLRQNAMSAKHFAVDVIDLLQEKTTIQKITEDYLQSRLWNIVEYQAELINRKSTGIDMSGCKAVRTFDSSDELGEVHRSFLRSYNTKNKVIRDFLYFLKAQGPMPLLDRLSPKLVSLIKLSISMHPFLNKENDQWIDFNEALEKAEARDFLGNAKELGINLRDLFKESGLKNVKIPKIYRPVQQLLLPKFLREEKEEVVLLKEKPKRKKGNKGKKKAVEKVFPVSTSPIEEKQEASLFQGGSLVSSEESPSISQPQDFPNNLAAEKELNETIPLERKSVEEEPSLDIGKNEISPQQKIRNKHMKTICDIFSPKGYAKLDSDKIINAWEHVLGEKGHHKENTGSSHQPLYATLSDGSRVVLGLFRSNTYGSRYVHYIRDAFDKIGFGRQWLEDQGYRLD